MFLIYITLLLHTTLFSHICLFKHFSITLAKFHYKFMEGQPFVFGSAVTGVNFTDREEDCKHLIANFKHGINTILISPRRWGKTSLVKKAINEVKSDKLKIVYLDVFACRSPQEFLSRFSENIIKQTSEPSNWIENIKNFLSRFNPKFSFKSDPLSEISLSFEILPKKEDISSILQLPEKIAQNQKCRIVVCIDEFQQIGEFKDSITFQKELRTVWQHQQLTSYCLFGSKKHLMTELFAKTNYPFYQFGDIIFLNKIPTEEWVKFIKARFKVTGKVISDRLADGICNKVENQSNYVQQLSWILWIKTDHEALEEDLKSSYNELLAHNSNLFERMTENLTAYQMNFLRAITDGIHSEFNHQEILQSYQLGTSANITRIKESLLNKDIINISFSKVTIPDAVLREWLRRQFI